jgi:hypothetical protein
MGNPSGALHLHAKAVGHFAAFHRRLRPACHQNLVGILLEMYTRTAAYSRACSKAHVDENRQNPASSTELDWLKEYKTYGTITGCAGPLLEYLPLVSLLAATRQPDPSAEASPRCRLVYDELKYKLLAWENQLAEAAGTGSIAAAMVLYNALRIFLDSIYHCNLPVTDRKEMIRPCLKQGLHWLELTLGTPGAYIIYWPVMAIGAHATTEEERKVVLKFFVGHKTCLAGSVR